MQTYSVRELQSMLGISRAVIGTLVDSGFVTPSRGPRREYRFTFQDVVLLRTAYGLSQSQIPARKILQALRRLRSSLPNEMPLTGLRITAVGNEVAVQEGSARRQVETGQLLFDFDVQATAPTNVRALGSSSSDAHDADPEPASRSTRTLTPLPTTGAAAPPTPRSLRGARVTREIDSADAQASAVAWFERAVELEDVDKRQAEAAYREAIRLVPDYVDAILNLGVLLGDAGRSAEALAFYGAALAHRPKEALLHFNAGVALEDLHRPAQALECYAECLRLDPTFADAHYNAARLHDELGHANQAIRHYSAYRRLQRR